MNRFITYELSYPITFIPFYIGFSSRGLKRPEDHIREAQNPKSFKKGNHIKHGERICNRYKLAEEFNDVVCGQLCAVIRGVFKSHKGWKIVFQRQ